MTTRARAEGTASEPAVYQARPRICDLGYLREPYRASDGSVGYRCSGEPLTLFVAKGGKKEDAEGKKCLCNALMANIGHPQVRAGKHVEPGLITAGDELAGIARFLPRNQNSYCASDVVGSLRTALQTEPRA